MIQRKDVNVYLMQNNGVPVVPFVQHESGWNLRLIYKDTDIPDGCTATIYAKKPSGKIIYNSGTVDAVDNIVTVPITNQTLAEAGRTFAQVQLRRGEEMISTFAVQLDVKESLAGDDAEESQNESDIFEAAAMYAAEEAAKKAAEYFKIDSTLSREGEAADAKAVGDAIAEATVEIDSTLTEAGKAADAKAVGDAIKNITIEVDPTLSQEGMAADAKAVGDKFEEYGFSIINGELNVTYEQEDEA